METAIAVEEPKPLMLPLMAEALQMLLNARKSDLAVFEHARNVLDRYYREYSSVFAMAGGIDGEIIIGDSTGE